ncbi:aldehyde dehydrogenase family protein [Paludibacterium denitrificans]|uniref:aldehyde dehydrogenase family protein n=1 Tax=Paludibacterium denitrificans TaxID=2675226 RepID=UPI0035E42C4B
MIVVPDVADAFVDAFLAEARALPRRPAPSGHHAGAAHPCRLARSPACTGAGCHPPWRHAAPGGQMPSSPGFFYPATVLDHVNADCRVYHEEVFGPVASILRARDEADAIRLANDTPFGLGAAIYTADVERGWALARDIEA